jgi:hypothetical protein
MGGKEPNRRRGLTVSRPNVIPVPSTTKVPFQLFTREQPGQFILAHATIAIEAPAVAQTVTFYDVDGTPLGTPLTLTESANIIVEYGKVAAVSFSDATAYTIQVTSVILMYDDEEKYALASAKYRLEVEYIGGGGGSTTYTAGNAGIVIDAVHFTISLAELDVGTLGGLPFLMTGLASGAIMYDNAGTWEPLPIGTPGQILAVSAGGLPYWEAAPSGLVSSVTNSDGSLTISPTTGAVIASLNPGHANTFTGLQTFSPGDFAFGGYGHDVITTPAKGDLWYFDGTNLVNLPIGTAGQVLEVVSGVPKWATLSITAPATPTSATSGSNSYTNTSDKMGGLGLQITPNIGTIMVTITGSCNFAAVASDVLTVEGVYYGLVSGGVPAVGAAATGTQMNPFQAITYRGGAIAGAEAITVGFTAVAFVTGLTPGTAYWFDIQLKMSNASGAAIVITGIAVENA